MVYGGGQTTDKIITQSALVTGCNGPGTLVPILPKLDLRGY